LKFEKEKNARKRNDNKKIYPLKVEKEAGFNPEIDQEPPRER